MFALYKSVSSFVLPTRGEGWCLPCVEAMACGLPIIVTNYSGPLSYLNESFSYPIKVRDILNDDGTAEPDLKESIRLMRHLYKNRREGKRKGRLARNFVETKLSPHSLAKNCLNYKGPFSPPVTIACIKHIPIDNDVSGLSPIYIPAAG